MHDSGTFFCELFVYKVQNVNIDHKVRGHRWNSVRRRMHTRTDNARQCFQVGGLKLKGSFRLSILLTIQQKVYSFNKICKNSFRQNRALS